MPQPCFFQTGSDSLGPAQAPSLYFVENGPANVPHTSLAHPKNPPLKKPSVPPHHGIQDSHQFCPYQPYLQVGRTQERCQRGKKEKHEKMCPAFLTEFLTLIFDMEVLTPFRIDFCRLGRHPMLSFPIWMTFFQAWLIQWSLLLPLPDRLPLPIHPRSTHTCLCLWPSFHASGWSLDSPNCVLIILTTDFLQAKSLLFVFLLQKCLGYLSFFFHQLHQFPWRSM